jgi:UDP-N-acetylglucosamine--N-acetylmuramyl-(pentapeptide) pyrophosphoryl-undecaprenol N-acetylglucosamine transferase
MKVIISGGGTGGHIFPAIAIANALKESDPGVDILFVGAKGKMEMEKVPAAGYPIKGIPIAGLQRRLTWKNLSFPFKLLMGMYQAKAIVKQFGPDVVVGVGGYASGPVLRVASRQGIPCLLQEQNSYPGITNRILSRKARKVCVAYENMERFFEKEKLVFTGNPVRQDIARPASRQEAMKHFELDEAKQTILVVGGSLGARSINQGVMAGMEKLDPSVQLLWQTGKYYYENIKNILRENVTNVKIHAFIQRMDLAYAAADVVISRAGALSVSELALVGKPVIFVPSPNVAEDHQTKNAMVMVQGDAAQIVKDHCVETVLDKAQALLKDAYTLKKLGESMVKYAKPNAACDIAAEVLKLGKR